MTFRICKIGSYYASISLFSILFTGLFTLAYFVYISLIILGILDSVFDPVEEPIQLGCPASSIGITEHVLKVGKGLLVCLLHSQSFSQVTDIIDALQLSDAYIAQTN